MALSKARVLNVILSPLKEGGGRRKMKGRMREGGRNSVTGQRVFRFIYTWVLADVAWQCKDT